MQHCDDTAIQWSVMELAGKDRCYHCSEILYVYDLSVSWEFRVSAKERQRAEAPLLAYQRSLPPLPRLERL
jgi:hypothetical protein